MSDSSAARPAAPVPTNDHAHAGSEHGQSTHADRGGARRRARGGRKRYDGNWRPRRGAGTDRDYHVQTNMDDNKGGEGSRSRPEMAEQDKQQITDAMRDMKIQQRSSDLQQTMSGACKNTTDLRKTIIEGGSGMAIDTSTEPSTTMSYSAPPTALFQPSHLTDSPSRRGPAEFLASVGASLSTTAKTTPPPIQPPSSAPQVTPSANSQDTTPTNPFATPTASKTLDAMALAGYEIPHLDHPADTLRQPMLILHRTDVPPVDRLHGLMASMHIELGKLMFHVNDQPKWAGPEINAWKEAVLMRLMTEVVPELGLLTERVGREVGVGMKSNAAGIRAFVGASGSH